MTEYVRNVPRVRRTTRTHGERKQDREARRNFEYEKAKAPTPIGPPVEVKVSCTCSEKPYAHQYHGDRR